MSAGEFLQSYRLCVLQHALKMIGRFLDFDRAGKSGYAQYVPYVLEQARRMLAELGGDFPRLGAALRRDDEGAGARGGEGERLRPLTETVPKPMLDVGGRPLIHYPLMMLRRAGITEVAINTPSSRRPVAARLGDGAALGIRITWAPEPVLFGTGGPLNSLRTFFGREPFVITNGDTILDLDLASMLAFHRERSALATIALCHPPNLDYYSRLEMDSAARLRRMRLLKRREPLEYTDYPAGLESARRRNRSKLHVLRRDHR